jgi:hypothetical protein
MIVTLSNYLVHLQPYHGEEVAKVLNTAFMSKAVVK